MSTSILSRLTVLAICSITTLGAVYPRASPSPEKYAVRNLLLDTDWTNKVGREPWSEYPRPQLQRQRWRSLNGIWTYLKGSPPMDTSLAELTKTFPPQPEDFAQRGREVLVPSCLESALSGIQEPLATFSWYRREFHIPEDWMGLDRNAHRILLNFGAVDYSAELFLNGWKMGSHHGGYTSWSVDITDKIQWSSNNEVLISVYDPTDGKSGENIGVGKQTLSKTHIFYTPCSGIWQTVWLEIVPRTYITRIEVQAAQSGDVTATVETNEYMNATVKMTLSKDSNIVASANARINEQFVFRVSHPQLWSPDSPEIYDVNITVANDIIQSYTAFRTISSAVVHGLPRPMLNDRFVFQYGTLDQGYWPDGIYTPPSRAAMQYDLKKLKQLGFNTVRKHVKVEPDLFYEDCDRLGLMVIQDIPNPNRDSHLTPEAQMTFNGEAVEIVQQLKNHPCIVTWSLFNEGWGQGIGSPEVDLIEMIRAVNAPGLIDAASGWNDHGAGHYSSNHYYPGPQCGITEKGKNTPSPGWDSRRIAIQSEFGGLGTRPDDKNLWQDPTSIATIPETYEISPSLEVWNSRAMELLEALVSQIENNACSGAIWTQTTDVEGEVNGLLTYDRRLFRPDVQLWKEMSEKIYLAAFKRAGASGSTVGLGEGAFPGQAIGELLEEAVNGAGSSAGVKEGDGGDARAEEEIEKEGKKTKAKG